MLLQGATQTTFLELLNKLKEQKKTKLTILLLGVFHHDSVLAKHSCPGITGFAICSAQCWVSEHPCTSAGKLKRVTDMCCRQDWGGEELHSKLDFC